MEREVIGAKGQTTLPGDLASVTDTFSCIMETDNFELTTEIWKEYPMFTRTKPIHPFHVCNLGAF